MLLIDHNLQEAVKKVQNIAAAERKAQEIGTAAAAPSAEPTAAPTATPDKTQPTQRRKSRAPPSRRISIIKLRGPSAQELQYNVDQFKKLIKFQNDQMNKNDATIKNLRQALIDYLKAAGKTIEEINKVLKDNGLDTIPAE